MALTDFLPSSMTGKAEKEDAKATAQQDLDATEEADADSPPFSSVLGSHDEEEPPPWIKAQNIFGAVFGNEVRNRRSWKLAALLSLAINAVLIFSLIAYATSSGIEVYAVERDQLGQVRFAGQIPKYEGDASERYVRSELRLLMRDLRTIATDPYIQESLIDRAYVHLRGNAYERIEEIYSQKKTNPHQIGKKYRRSIEIQSVIPVPESNTWKIEWIETKTPLGQGEAKKTAWEAYLAVTQEAPKTEEAAINNPAGLYVTSIEWTRKTPVSGVQNSSPSSSSSAQRAPRQPAPRQPAPQRGAGSQSASTF